MSFVFTSQILRLSSTCPRRSLRCKRFRTKAEKKSSSAETTTREKAFTKRLADGVGVSLGPISLSFSEDFDSQPAILEDEIDQLVQEEGLDAENPYGKCISTMTTEEWRENFEKDGTVDLFVEEEFNAGSRLIGGREVHLGGTYGIGTGEGPSRGLTPSHPVQIHNKYDDTILELEIPEDRYVLWEAEDNGMNLPYACRMGCCTACAVRVVSGDLYQPEALGISKKLKDQGYGLMCVGYPRSKLVLETVTEDEVYDLQFGQHFEENALKKVGPNVVRDDFALELADMDE